MSRVDRNEYATGRIVMPVGRTARYSGGIAIL